MKTDAIDPHTLARLLRMGFVPEAHQLPPENGALRDLPGQRRFMKHTRTTLMLRITSIPARFNITDPAVGPSRSGFADFMSECTIPAEYRMTVLMYHRQCLQVAACKKQLKQYFKVRLRQTATAQLLVSLPGRGDITGTIIAWRPASCTSSLM